MSWGNVPDWSVMVAESILRNLKLKDSFTFYHCARVGRTARKLAQAMGLNEYDQIRLEFAGLFHDIGKMGTPDKILLKPDRLTKDEYEHMKCHPLLSAEILEPLADNEFFKSLLPGIRSHHERIDGKGYPHAYSGEHIPLAARIISVVDTVDAMMHTRPYRLGLSFEVTKKELIKHTGTQFDASIVKIYLDAVRFWKNSEKENSQEQVVQKILKVA